MVKSVLLKGYKKVYLGKPEEGGESTNIELWWHIISCGIHLDNLNLLSSHLVSQLLVDWCQLLAVSAPWGVELNQHVLGVLHHQLVKVLGDGHLGVGLGVVGQGFGFDVGVNLAGFQQGHEGLEGFNGEFIL